MNLELNYTNFKRWAENFEFKTDDINYASEAIVSTLNDFVDDNDIIVFYPKNLFKEKGLEIIIITKDKKMMVINYDEEYVDIRTFKIEDIEHITFKNRRNGQNNVLMNLKFYDGQVINFNSQNDSNSHWHNKYVQTIKNIYKIVF